MVTAPVADPSEHDAPLPRHSELIRLSLRIDRLQASQDEQQAAIAAQSLNYVAALVAEIDRVCPKQCGLAANRP
jgi:hypothetical protein